MINCLLKLCEGYIWTHLKFHLLLCRLKFPEYFDKYKNNIGLNLAHRGQITESTRVTKLRAEQGEFNLESVLKQIS